MKAMFTDTLWVVEKCDGEALIGRIAFDDGAVVISDGFVGRPYRVEPSELARMVLAEEHPDVELVSP